MALMNVRIHHLHERGTQASRRVVQYLTRTGAYAPDALAYLTRTSPDTIDRGDLVTHQVGNLPAWAADDAGRFFARAAQEERAGTVRQGRWATTWQMALPRELTREAQWAMGRAFVAAHLEHHAYLVVMHDPVTDGAHQPHLHVVFSERTDDGTARSPEVYFRRPEVGGCPKDRWFNHRSSAQALRTSWCDWTNLTLEQAGQTARLHPGSLRNRDIARPPEPKMGYSANAVLQVRRDAIKAQRDTAQEAHNAHEGWEARKALLGITDSHAVDPQTFLAASVARARACQAGHWAPHAPSAQAQHEERIWRTLQYWQRERQEVDAALATLDREDRLLTRAHGRRRSPAREQDIPTGLRARIFEEDRYERDQRQGR